MKEAELRAVVLQEFYTHRRVGTIGINVSNLPNVVIEGIDQADLLRACDQLGEFGLLDWKPLPGRTGDTIGGAGKINGFGIDVVEGEREAPLPIHIDQSSHVQHINISGQHGGVQVAGAHSSQSQSVAQGFEKLIQAIDGASVGEAEKREGKSLLGTLLNSAVITALIGPAAKALAEKYGLRS